MKSGRIAVPSNGECGLEGTRAGHFGHCDVFTLIDVENRNIKKISILNNSDHVQGGCMVPVILLCSHNVNALIVGGSVCDPLQDSGKWELMYIMMTRSP